jgi:branched-chain amino acid aminotransferase
MTTAKQPKYLLYNNKCHPIDEPIFKAANRSFRYGDGIFETIRLVRGQLHLFEYHMERLLNGVDFLKIELPSNWNKAYFKKKVWELLEKNGETRNGKIRLSIFRADGGTYTPKSSKGNLLIEYEPYNSDHFILNKKRKALKWRSLVRWKKPAILFPTLRPAMPWSTPWLPSTKRKKPWMTRSPG